MRLFDFENEYKKLLTPTIVDLLTQIHELKGIHTGLNLRKETLYKLVEIAKIQSTEASNRIEGIITTDDRLKKLLRENTMPKNRSEREIVGYRDVLAAVHENYEYIPVTPGMILQLHRDLYKYSGSTIGGKFKNSDNVIAEALPDGTKKVRFDPVPAWETSEAMRLLCSRFNEAIKTQEMDPLLLFTIFILDFLCVHPFNDGNGRMSRLLTLLLLYRSGYTVGQYVSIEKLISNTKAGYYEALQASSCGWHERKNDYAPFAEYMLGVVIAAYRDFTARTKLLAEKGVSKPNRIRDIIKNTTGRISKSEITEQCPDVSQTTVQRTLNDLLKSEEIIKIGGGRYTSYIWNREKE